VKYPMSLWAWSAPHLLQRPAFQALTLATESPVNNTGSRPQRDPPALDLPLQCAVSPGAAQHRLRSGAASLVQIPN